MFNPVFSILKKEFLDNIRNKWIIIISIFFIILTLISSYFGSLSSQGWQDFQLTIEAMGSYIILLIPIIALMLGYAAIIGEIERGSMNALLALPTNKNEILLGKFLGLGTVLSISILIGFGISGIFIALNVSSVSYVDYLIFIGAAILYGLVFLAISIFLSTLFKKRSSAMGGAIFIWFLFNIIYPIIVVGFLIASVGLNITAQEVETPGWYFISELFNPNSVFTNLLRVTILPTSIAGSFFSTEVPSYYSGGFLVLVLFLWIIIFYVLSMVIFDRKEI